MAVRHWFFTLFPRLRRPVSRRWYEYISTLDKNADMLFMNYGYASLDRDATPLELSAVDEKHRYAIQLYHHVASAINWSGLDGLEVGSGRGGGANYIMRRFKPNSMIGIDLTANAVDFCHQQYATKGLSFTRGDAEALQFENNSFDVVVNVESSLYYPHIERFFSEVVRVLKPDGYFLYADIRYREEVELWRAQLRNTGLHLLKEEDITTNVAHALLLDQKRKQTLIRRHVPRILERLFTNFAGVNGAGLRQSKHAAPKRNYLSFTFRKPAS